MSTQAPGGSGIQARLPGPVLGNKAALRGGDLGGLAMLSKVRMGMGWEYCSLGAHTATQKSLQMLPNPREGSLMNCWSPELRGMDVVSNLPYCSQG